MDAKKLGKIVLILGPLVLSFWRSSVGFKSRRGKNQPSRGVGLGYNFRQRLKRWPNLDMKTLLLVAFALCIFANSVFAQKFTEPRLVGVWRLGYEDYGEFIYHKVDYFASYLKEDPNAKMVARLCSSDNMPLALASSHGFAYAFPESAESFQVPADRMFFARWSRCESKSEQYWFLPENSSIEYDEMIPAERVRVNRLLVSSYGNPAKRGFAKNLKQFIAELKNNPRTQGFIIRNLGMSNRTLKEALRQLRNEKVRFQILSKQSYISYYPEFMTVMITE
jgi:hypothetical protein